MALTDEDLKAFRVYSDHHMSNLRVGTEILFRNIRMMQSEMEKLCKRVETLEKSIGTFTTQKSPKVPALCPLLLELEYQNMYHSKNGCDEAPLLKPTFPPKYKKF